MNINDNVWPRVGRFNATITQLEDVCAARPGSRECMALVGDACMGWREITPYMVPDEPSIDGQAAAARAAMGCAE